MAEGEGSQRQEQQASSDTTPAEPKEPHTASCWVVVTAVQRLQTAVIAWSARHIGTVQLSLGCLLASVAAAYLALCLYTDLHGAVPLIVVTVIFIVIASLYLVKWQYGDVIRRRVAPLSYRTARLWRTGRCVWHGAVVVGLVVYLVVDVRHTPYNFVALSGMLVFVVVGFVSSTSPADVDWGVVYSGILVQTVMGLVVLRWQTGADVLRWVAQQINTFLNYGLVGARFVFGEAYTDHHFAMSIMPILAFFLAVVNLLYHWGVMQLVISTVGSALQLAMGTTRVETFVAVGDIFLGPDAAVLMVKSSVPAMTTSQLHTLLACGLATIDGGMLPLFHSFGIPVTHLITASFMSAPAALAFSKLLCPENPNQRAELARSKPKFEKSEACNSLAAFSAGAVSSIPIIGTVLVMIISFISLLAFINTTLTWLGHRAGVNELTIQKLCSWVLTPVAFLMGVEWADCGHVAQLIGIKTVINEFVAYSELATFIANRENGTTPVMSVRSEAIATYSLCGFSNFGTLGFMVGFLSILAPQKRGVITKVAIRSLVASTFACLSTATIAALLYKE